VPFALQTPLTGGVYKEQKENLDKLPDIGTPTLQTLKNSLSRDQKRLIVLFNFVSLETCGYIMNQLQEASSDIIIVSNEFLFKKDIATEVEKQLSRGCNLIDITNLQTINIKQRMVYTLLEKGTFSVRDVDHVVFTLLSEYSRGSTTVIHLLTSLMRNSGDSRTGFNLVKQQLKLHIGHTRYLKASQNLKNSNDVNGSVSGSKLYRTIHMFINDIIRSYFSLPSQHLLCCLAVLGSIPLPQFFISELDNLITAAITTEEDKRMQRLYGLVAESLLEQLVQGGIIRKFPHPIVYHKDFNPQSVNPNIELKFVPKLLCYAVESEMDIADKAVCIMCIQQALENILTGKSTVQVNVVHLHYLLAVCHKLLDVCCAEHSLLGDSFSTGCIKLQLQLAYCYHNMISDINI